MRLQYQARLPWSRCSRWFIIQLDPAGGLFILILWSLSPGIRRSLVSGLGHLALFSLDLQFGLPVHFGQPVILKLEQQLIAV